jgi:hypothetical protein
VVDDDSSRARLWGLADQVFPVYAAYRKNAARVGRTIPILQLIPAKTPPSVASSSSEPAR